MPGWDEFYFEVAERLARHGYEVICPDLYCRFGHGLPDDVYAKVRTEGGVHDESVVADAAAALAWLQARPTHNDRVGILGTCSGGRHALLVASVVSGFDAVIDCGEDGRGEGGRDAGTSGTARVVETLRCEGCARRPKPEVHVRCRVAEVKFPADAAQEFNTWYEALRKELYGVDAVPIDVG
jgi:hypothetical protein